MENAHRCLVLTFADPTAAAAWMDEQPDDVRTRAWLEETPLATWFREEPRPSCASRVFVVLDETLSADATAALRRSAADSGAMAAEETRADCDWRSRHGVHAVGLRWEITPPWREDIQSPGRFRLILEPGLAFGLGTHASSALALEAIEDEVARGDAVIDFGCGSGILAMAALSMGAAAVQAVDHDPIAIEEAAANAARNRQGDRMTFAVGSTDAVMGPCDLLIANVREALLMPLLPPLLDRAAARRGLVLSGIGARSAPDFGNGLSDFGYRTRRLLVREGFACVVADRV